MRSLYFLILKLFGKNPTGKIYQWAYLRCFRSYMASGSPNAYFKFADDFFKKACPK